MLELLNQLYGFSSDDRIKVLAILLWKARIYLLTEFCSAQVVAATNRVDILDPALLRSGESACLCCWCCMGSDQCSAAGRLDRKIEFPHPTEEARARILQIHSRKMNVSPVSLRILERTA